jgi:hypothetical protein
MGNNTDSPLAQVIENLKNAFSEGSDIYLGEVRGRIQEQANLLEDSDPETSNLIKQIYG